MAKKKATRKVDWERLLADKNNEMSLREYAEAYGRDLSYFGWGPDVDLDAKPPFDDVPLREAARLLGIAYPTAVKWADPDKGGLFKFEKVNRLKTGMRIPLSEIERIKKARIDRLATAKSAGSALRLAEEVHREHGEMVQFDLAVGASVYGREESQNEKARAFLFRAVDAYRRWEAMGGLIEAMHKRAQMAFHQGTEVAADFDSETTKKR